MYIIHQLKKQESFCHWCCILVSSPILNGRKVIGQWPGKRLRSCDSNIRFDNFSVTTFIDSTSIPTNEHSANATQQDVMIYPNPTNDRLLVSNISDFTGIEIISTNGQL